MSLAMPDPHNRAFNAIDILVQAFADLLNAAKLVVVCRYAPTGDIIATNAYTDLFSAMLAFWTNQKEEDTCVEAHPTVPLTDTEEREWG